MRGSDVGSGRAGEEGATLVEAANNAGATGTLLNRTGGPRRDATRLDSTWLSSRCGRGMAALKDKTCGLWLQPYGTQLSSTSSSTGGTMPI